MAQRKRTPQPQPQQPAEAEKVEPPKPPPAPAGVPQAETVCVTFDLHQRERMRALLKQEPRDWGRTQWVRHAMAVQELVERALDGIMPELDAYAVQHRLTVPQARRKRDDWEWMVDALGMLARERLQELKSNGKPPTEQ